MSAEQEADDLRELIADERLRHMDERSRLGEKVLEERRLRYEVEEEDAIKLADLTALREADQATIATLGMVNKELADALVERMDRTAPNYWRTWDGKLNDENDRGGHYRRIFAALHAAGRLLKGENYAQPKS